MFLPSAALCIVTLTTVPAISDDCGRDDSARIDYRGGSWNPGLLNFKYESRVESGSKTSRKYIWCIENLHRFNIAEFMWGSNANEKLYFHGFVEPGEAIGRDDTDSTEAKADPRILKFRRFNASVWDAITTETIFPVRWGETGRPIQVAQAQQPEIAPISIFPGTINLETLSRDEKAFAKYVQEQKKIELSTTFVVTIPTNAEARRLVEKRGYEKYNPDDFARIRVGLHNTITHSNAGPISSISIQVDPAQLKDLSKIANAVKEVPFTVEIDPTNSKSQPTAYRMKWKAKLDSPSLSKELIRGPTGVLHAADVTLNVGANGSEFTFGSIPAVVLLPGRK